MTKRKSSKKRRRKAQRQRAHCRIPLVLSLIVIGIAIINELLGGMPIFHARGNDGWQLSWNQLLEAVQEKSFLGSGTFENSSEADTDASAATADLSTTAGNMDVHFIDVGQGDSTLIECDGEYMLVDAGQNNQGLVLWKYLQEQGATDLKYVIGTHPDADHVGGMDELTSPTPKDVGF